MTETRRLRWEDGPSGLNQLGYAGNREDWLFCIFKTTDDPDDDTHALMSLLPGGLGDYPRSDDPADLKRAAEERLAGFVSSIGAVFPEAALKLADDWGQVSALHGYECAAALREAIGAALAGKEAD